MSQKYEILWDKLWVIMGFSFGLFYTVIFYFEFNQRS